MSIAALSDIDQDEERDLYEMANLYPRETGLPMTVWVSPKGETRHDARVKVCMKHGDRMSIRETATVSIRPEPRLMHGELSSADVAVVTRWIELNTEVLMDYWDGRTGTSEMAQRLRSL